MSSPAKYMPSYTSNELSFSLRPQNKLSLPGALAARRNFQAQTSKFNIAGIQSEATTTAGTKWPSSGVWTVADFSPSALAGPPGRPRPNVEISAAVMAPLLGHMAQAVIADSD